MLLLGNRGEDRNHGIAKHAGRVEVLFRVALPSDTVAVGFGADSGGNSATMAAWRIEDPSGILSSPAVGSKMTSFFSASVGIFASRSVIETWSRC